jgi:uncharacterized damage-inducible protein DinB
MKTMIEMFLKELEQEAKTTRKMLAIVPEDKYDWKPHEKSMIMQRLATHIAELPGWISMAINTDELDFENNNYAPKTIKNNKELLNYFEELMVAAKADLEKTKDELLSKKWVLRSGKTIYNTSTKGETIRVAISQTIHHRAQLGVYLRLLNIPIPGSYGPSADDQSF